MNIMNKLNSNPIQNPNQAQFPALQNRTYFNYGGQGVLSHQVLAKISENYNHIEALGSFSIAANKWIIEEINELKELIAQELNVAPTTIALTENTTHGCNIALWSLNWHKGDRLLISDCEHPGILAIVKSLMSRFGIEVDYFSLLANDEDEITIRAITNHLKPRTRMIMCSHVCWNTGQVLPLSEIVQNCHQQGVLVAIDAAQSVGVLPLNLSALDVDFYAFTGHKWWNGPLGVGGLYINPKIMDDIFPTFAGWRGLNYNSPEIEWRRDAQKFEVATSSYPLYGALREAINQGNLFGNQEQRFHRICELSQLLWQALQDLPNIICIKNIPPRCGLVSFAVIDKSHNFISKLLEEEHKIMVRSIPSPDCLRVSLQYLSNVDEINFLVEVLKNL